MRKILYLRKKSDNNLSEYEKLLETTLMPVTPNPRFIRDLQNLLISQMLSLPVRSKQNTDQIILFAAAGLISGTMVLLLGIRSMIMILSALGLLSQYKKSLHKDRIADTQTLVS